jgi:hypothetical protein
MAILINVLPPEMQIKPSYSKKKKMSNIEKSVVYFKSSGGNFAGVWWTPVVFGNFLKPALTFAGKAHIIRA